MSQGLFSSLFTAGLSSASAMDRYLALSAVRDLTQNHVAATELHAAAALGIRSLAGDFVSGAEAELNRHMAGGEAQFATLMRSPQGAAVVDAYRRFRALSRGKDPSTATWAARVAPLGALEPMTDDDWATGPVSLRTFFEDMAKRPANFPEDLADPGPDITVFSDAQALVISSAKSGYRACEDHLQTELSDFFGKPVPLAGFLAGFLPDLPGYRLARLELEMIGRKPQNQLDVRGAITASSGGAIVAKFRGAIPARPEDGSPWIARNYAINVPNDALQRQGIGRKLTQRFLALLQRIGVDALEFKVSQAGALVFPRMGFDFARPATRDRLKIQLREYLRDHFPKRSPSDDERWAQIEHSWELAKYQLEDRHLAGRDFLMSAGSKGDRFAYPVAFLTRADYPGWGHLFDDHMPPEWSALPEGTRRALQEHNRNLDQIPQILTSFQDHVGNLQDALGNWIVPVDFYLNNRGGQGLLHMLPAEEVAALHEQFVNTAHLIAWMASDASRGTRLARAFWATTTRETWNILPRIAAAARELLGLSITLPYPY